MARRCGVLGRAIRRTDVTIRTESRLCICGKRKLECACWATGAGDEAAHMRDGLDRDQLALVDYIRTVLHHGKAPIPSLVDALRIEIASDGGFRTRVRVAWQLLSRR